MLLTIKLAKRNIFRHLRRTILTVMLISFGLAALLFTDSFVKGMSKVMINISTETYLGHAQIHKVGYRTSQDVDDYINDVAGLERILKHDNNIKHYAPRAMAGAMLSSTENVTSILFVGIDGEKEANVSAIKGAVIDGNFLSGTDSEIMIGYDLAALLGVVLGDRIVVTLSSAHGGELSQALFRVSGLLKFNDRAMDKEMAFVNLKRAQALLNIKGVHEVVIQFQDLALANNPNLNTWGDINSHDWEILNWKTLVPQLGGILDMSQYSTLIVSIIMFSLVSLGLINSMFMSIYERHQEFGVLMALGTRPIQIFYQIMSEGMLIGWMGVVVGLVIGGAISVWFSIYGIDYGNLEMSGLTLSKPIYSVIEPLAFIELAIWIFLITTLACVYPAMHASQLSPSFAMRKVA